MTMHSRDATSMATILTFENNRDAQSEWSEVWSTTNIPGMDNATGVSGTRYRIMGRRRLRVSSLVLGALLTMHCQVPSSALTGGFFVFIIFLILAIMILSSPLRHFEVYLGQWSINGPGRAFRIVPILDGIGIAMCLNAIFRAIMCSVIAAMAVIYVVHSVRDDKLPFTYCRKFDLTPYDPILKDITNQTGGRSKLRFQEFETVLLNETSNFENELELSTVGFVDRGWRKPTKSKTAKMKTNSGHKTIVNICNETYPSPYPALYSTPAYNFFYVEVVELPPDYNMGHVNISIMVVLAFIWAIIWMFMIIERLRHKRMVWNNTPLWFIYAPWIWVAVLGINAVMQISSTNSNLQNFFRIEAKDVVSAITTAFDVALYIHAAGTGTELITGKGLNRFAAGHIDPLLNSENLWHSGTVLLLCVLHSVSATLCAVVDQQLRYDPTAKDINESFLWILPMYSRCTAKGNYSHFVSAITFTGFTFSYITVAYIFLKTALHTIFEYRVKLVFVEQWVVGGLIVTCTMLSFMFATGGGLPLLEGCGCILTGVVTCLICSLELVALLYVYRSHDFGSDANVSMEESTCSSRINYQWQCLPFVTITTLCMKIAVLFNMEVPRIFLSYGLIPLVCVILAIPLRAIHNTYSFLHPSRNN